MTIVRTWSVRPKAGRFDDAIGLLTDGAKLLDRHGASEIRLTHGALVGNHSGSLVVSCEFASFTRHGEFIDELAADVENQAYMHRAREAEAPFTLEGTAVLAEIPLGRFAQARPRHQHESWSRYTVTSMQRNVAGITVVFGSPLVFVSLKSPSSSAKSSSARPFASAASNAFMVGP